MSNEHKNTTLLDCLSSIEEKINIFSRRGNFTKYSIDASLIKSALTEIDILKKHIILEKCNFVMFKNKES
jgi:hypothetical protein